MFMKLKKIYIAGYIDGDGCFFLQKIKNPYKYRAKIIISSTNKQVLESFKKDFNGCIQAMPIYFEKHKPQFHWYITGYKALEFLNSFKHFLIERKKESEYFEEYILTKNHPIKDEIIKKMKNYRHLNKQITKEVFEDIKKTPFLGNFTEENAAYLAGFIDAECSLIISKYKTKNSPNYIYKIVLSCNNTSPNIFYWFMEKIGGSVCFVNRKAKNPKHKNQINWSISGKKLYSILQQVFPFLRSKKIVCQKLMEFYEMTLKKGGDRHSEAFKTSYANIISAKEKIISEVHKLNSKGK